MLSLVSLLFVAAIVSCSTTEIVSDGEPAVIPVTAVNGACVMLFDGKKIQSSRQDMLGHRQYKVPAGEHTLLVKMVGNGGGLIGALFASSTETTLKCNFEKGKSYEIARNNLAGSKTWKVVEVKK